MRDGVAYVHPVLELEVERWLDAHRHGHPPWLGQDEKKRSGKKKWGIIVRLRAKLSKSDKF